MESGSTSISTAASARMSTTLPPTMVLTNGTALGVLQSYCNQVAPNTIYPQFIFQEIKNESSQSGYSPVPGAQSTLQPTREIAQISAVVAACQILSALRLPNVIVPIEILDDDAEQDEPKDFDELREVVMIGMQTRKTLKKVLTQSGALREDGISRVIGRVFWKCFRATRLYIHHPFGTAA
ncbi:hypothetical protein BGZ83_002141 [Gryganskiella cystojenkinii]|nr:hypothetical protein BGZ83_002141 [Gryganskiella cystojenkinii]